VVNQQGGQVDIAPEWTDGTRLAEQFINNEAGGIDGHPVGLKYEDSQSDPKQSVTVAQKFVGDSDVILVFGDYSSAASIPASPIYTQGQLVQYGFNNSNAAFTEDGTEYQWSSSTTTRDTYVWTASYLQQQGIASVGVTYLNTPDWGIPAFEAFQAQAEQVGLTITDAEAVLDTSDDYRAALQRATRANPEAFVHIGYGPDGAKIVTQLRAIGYQGPFYGGQDEQSFNETPDAEGAIIAGQFVEDSTDPGVQEFVQAFHDAYPDQANVTSFEAGAYDALNIAVAAARAGGTTRAGILEGFRAITDVPTVIYGPISFDQTTRRILDPQFTPLQLTGGAWVQLGA
jgi:branched-chain amino acid transport system substrate-binding protein